MNHQQIAAVLIARERAEDRLVNIYEDIVEAEKKLLDTIEDQEMFREIATNLHDQHDRHWGDDPIRGLSDIVVKEDGIAITLKHEEYWRGCHTDTQYERVVIPRYLIDAEGAEYQEALRRYTEERAGPVRKRLEELAREAEAERIAEEQSREEHDRAEFLRLKEKYERTS